MKYYVYKQDNEAAMPVLVSVTEDYKQAINIANEDLPKNGECFVADNRMTFKHYSTAHSERHKMYEAMTTDEWNATPSMDITQSDKPSVYIDVDGTAAYFYKDGKGLSYPELLEPKYHYFNSLEPHYFVVDLARELHHRGLDVCILSATDRGCISDRFEWLKREMPFISDENIFLCPVGANKTAFAKGNADLSILIDDYEENLEAWEQVGGKAVKSINTINSFSAKYCQIFTSDIEESFIRGDEHYIKLLDDIADKLDSYIKVISRTMENGKIFSKYEK